MECLSKPDHNLIRIYKKFLYVLLTLGILGVMLTFYYFIWLSVPSTIMIKAGVDQELDLKVPASGELYKEAIEVSGRISSSPRESSSVYIDLRRPVTIKASQEEQYKLRLKLFGMIPLKEVNVEVIQDLRLKPAGIPIGIYVKTQGVLVVGVGEFEGEDGQKYSPGKFVFQVGDYILEINDEEINAKKELADPNSVFHYYQKLIALRKREKVMVYGACELLEPENENLYVYTRTLREDSSQGAKPQEENRQEVLIQEEKLREVKLLVACNFTEKETAYELPEKFVGGELLIGNYQRKEAVRSLMLQPYEALVIKTVGK